MENQQKFERGNLEQAVRLAGGYRAVGREVGVIGFQGCGRLPEALRLREVLVHVVARSQEALLFTISDEVKERADGFIGKPFAEGELSACLKTVLEDGEKFMAQLRRA